MNTMIGANQLPTVVACLSMLLLASQHCAPGQAAHLSTRPGHQDTAPPILVISPGDNGGPVSFNTNPSVFDSQRQKRQLQTVSSPLVTAECTNRTIYVDINFRNPFGGIVYVRDFRATCAFEPPAETTTRSMSIRIPLENRRNRDTVYCGPRVKRNGDVIIAMEVHEHKILETGADRVFLITCPAARR